MKLIPKGCGYHKHINGMNSLFKLKESQISTNCIANANKTIYILNLKTLMHFERMQMGYHECECAINLMPADSLGERRKKDMRTTTVAIYQ